MLNRMYDLPSGIEGLEAKGMVTRHDCDTAVRPLFEGASRDSRRLRLLYHFGPEFEGFTLGAALQDLSLGLKHMKVFERCAVVTDRAAVRDTCRLMAPLIPSPLRVFQNAEMQSALEWLGSPNEARHLVPKFLPGKEVLVVEVNGPLGREDFEALSAEADPWIEEHRALHGLVVHAKKFPGWENLGSFFRHVAFVGDHSRKIHRVAIVADGILPEVMPRLASYFVKAELRHFGYDELESAIAWASEGKKKKKAAKRAA
jgi:hypothetical protein